ncbi:iron uptake porin [Leptolyngbyaceae cyanobacterium UHCC 1019]
MLKLVRNSLLLSQVLLAAIAVSSGSAQEVSAQEVSAQEKTAVSVIESFKVSQLDVESVSINEIDQVTSVSQLTDVRPTDWAFQALQSLVERYGCIVGYPDKTFRGNRALTRFEFAAGLNACLDKIQELIAAATADFVRKEDLEVVKRLQEEFGTELAALRGRVEGLEVRTATLEKQQFSTTTKLNGEVVFGVVSAFTGQGADGADIPRTTIVGDRVRLNFDTTFTGKDVLRTRLQATSLNALSGASTFTPEGDLRFAGAAFDNDNNNSVSIDALLYQFPVGEKLTVTLEANAGAIDDFTDTVNPFLDGDGGTGALTHFGTRNAIYYLVNGTGIGLKYELNDFIEISAGYLANDASSPLAGAGLFNGSYGAIGQLTIRPSEKFTVGLTYIHSYNTDFTANGSTGSNRANLRSFFLSNPLLAGTPLEGLDIPTSSNAYGAAASFQLSPKFVINGSFGYTTTRTLATRGVLPRGDLNIFNWAVGLAFPDLGRDGSLGGIIVGVEPRVDSVSSGLRSVIGRDPSTSIHVEAFYQYRLNDNIAITPGVVWLTAPDHNSSNQDIVIGTIRTTFTF